MDVFSRICCVTYSEPYCQSGMFVCLSVAGRASGQCSSSTGHASGWCCCYVAAVRSRRDSGSRQTLLILQFVIEFANIWAQYSPSTYASTLVGFFDLCPNGSPANVTHRAHMACLSIENCATKLHHFCACCLRPWLGPPLMALRYVMYVRFYGWRYVVIIPWASGQNQARRYV